MDRIRKLWLLVGRTFLLGKTIREERKKNKKGTGRGKEGRREKEKNEHRLSLRIKKKSNTLGLPLLPSS